MKAYISLLLVALCAVCNCRRLIAPAAGFYWSHSPRSTNSRRVEMKPITKHQTTQQPTQHTPARDKQVRKSSRLISIGNWWDSASTDTVSPETTAAKQDKQNQEHVQKNQKIEVIEQQIRDFFRDVLYTQPEHYFNKTVPIYLSAPGAEYMQRELRAIKLQLEILFGTPKPMPPLLSFVTESINCFLAGHQYCSSI
eukprot:115215_1